MPRKKQRKVDLKHLGIPALRQLEEQGFDVSAALKAKGATPDPNFVPQPNSDALGKQVPQSNGNSVGKYHVSVADERTADGITFDSKLEMNAYKWLKEHGIAHERQTPLEIQPGFEIADRNTKSRTRKIPAITYKTDFLIPLPVTAPLFHVSRVDDRNCLLIDMKGMETDVFKLKWKLLAHRGFFVHAIKSVTKLAELLHDYELLNHGE